MESSGKFLERQLDTLRRYRSMPLLMSINALCFVGRIFPTLKKKMDRVRSLLKDNISQKNYEANLRSFFSFDAKGIFLDIGANKGFYSSMMAKKCRIVHAWEPNPATAGILKENVSKFDNVLIHIEALGNHETTLPFYLHSDSGHDGLMKDANFGTYSGREIQVPVRKLDSYTFDGRIGLIKIDVEGYEVEVVKGGLKTIIHHRPKLIIDIHETGNIERIMKILPGYKWLGVRDPESAEYNHLVGLMTS